MMLATMGQGFYNLDEIRHSIERMAPAHYLGSTYYEHWLAGLERILGEKGRLTSTEIETRLAKTRGDRAGAAARAQRQHARR
jgi:nitrile hydratase